MGKLRQGAGVCPPHGSLEVEGGGRCCLWSVGGGHGQDVGTPVLAVSFRVTCPRDKEAELGKLRQGSSK